MRHVSVMVYQNEGGAQIMGKTVDCITADAGKTTYNLPTGIVLVVEVHKWRPLTRIGQIGTVWRFWRNLRNSQRAPAIERSRSLY